MADPASRKWQLTFNNPQEHGWTHDRIKETLGTFPAICYWCMSDEKGLEEETPHTHLFINLSPSNCRFSTLKNKFPTAHIEKAMGTSQQNRDYVAKDGKWKDNEKGETSIPGTFEEWGEMPQEQQGKSKQADMILEMLKDGASNLEIIEAIPSAMMNVEKIERTRSILRDARFATEWRNLEVTYMFGKTGAGKTRSVMDTYGYSACYRVTDYKHPFDTYDGQDVIIFEEFRGGLKHGDMLNFLDGYPLLLPCRYFNRQACYTKVFIVTNIPPTDQYRNIDSESQRAFFRRISAVVEFCGEVERKEWPGVQAYIDRHSWVAAAESAEESSLFDLDE